MEKERIRSIIESLMFISGEPLGLDRISQVIKEADRKQIREALEELRDDFLSQGRGLRIAEVAGGYQVETAKENAEFLARLVKTRPIRLTRPSLETLAIIAYRQPLTRLEVDQIRGVDSSGVVKTLLDYGFILVVGRKDVPGRPLIYGTSKRFLEFFRLNHLSDLPSLEEFFSQAEEQTGEGGDLFASRYQETPGGENTEAKPEGNPNPEAAPNPEASAQAAGGDGSGETGRMPSAGDSREDPGEGEQ